MSWLRQALFFSYLNFGSVKYFKPCL